MVMVWWQGMQCETHREDLCGGEQGTKKNTLFEKTIYPAKKSSKKKNEKNHNHGLRGNRPISPLETNLRVSLRTTGTSRFWLHTVRRSSFALYGKHDRQPECINNFCAVLPAVLRYCPGSTLHRYAL